MWLFVLLLGLKFIKKKGIFFLFILVGVMVLVILMFFLYELGGDFSCIYYGIDIWLFVFLIGCLFVFVWLMYCLLLKNFLVVGK